MAEGWRGGRLARDKCDLHMTAIPLMSSLAASDTHAQRSLSPPLAASRYNTQEPQEHSSTRPYSCRAPSRQHTLPPHHLTDSTEETNVNHLNGPYTSEKLRLAGYTKIITSNQSLEIYIQRSHYLFRQQNYDSRPSTQTLCNRPR